jgi:hypothetical protein
MDAESMEDYREEHENLSGTQESDSAEELLRKLMDVSAPYLRRKKMTPRHECNELNRIWEKCEEKLKSKKNGMLNDETFDKIFSWFVDELTNPEPEQPCSTPVDSVLPSTDPHRGVRCGLCYWALYDGTWCQNSSCKNHGKSVSGDVRKGGFVYLTNREAQVLMYSNDLAE